MNIFGWCRCPFFYSEVSTCFIFGEISSNLSKKSSWVDEEREMEEEEEEKQTNLSVTSLKNKGVRVSKCCLSLGRNTF